MNSDERIKSVQRLIDDYGSIPGDHHKTWVIDQILRTILQDGYATWVKEYECCENEDVHDCDPDECDFYEWDTGIAP